MTCNFQINKRCLTQTPRRLCKEFATRIPRSSCGSMNRKFVFATPHLQLIVPTSEYMYLYLECNKIVSEDIFSLYIPQSYHAPLRTENSSAKIPSKNFKGTESFFKKGTPYILDISYVRLGSIMLLHENWFVKILRCFHLWEKASSL